jgi:hypothetical protein
MNSFLEVLEESIKSDRDTSVAKKNFEPAKEVDMGRYEDLINIKRGTDNEYKSKIGNWTKFIIVRDEEEWTFFLNERRAPEAKSRRSRGYRNTLRTWGQGFSYAAQLTLKNGMNIIAFKHDTTEEQIDKLMGYLWFEDSRMNRHIVDWNDQNEKLGYEIVKNGDLPQFLKYKLIRTPLEKRDTYSGAKSVKEAVNNIYPLPKFK